MKKLLAIAIPVLLLAICVALAVRGGRQAETVPPVPKLSAVEQFEKDLAVNGKALLEVTPITSDDTLAMVRRDYTAQQLTKTPLYIKSDTDKESFLCLIGADSVVKPATVVDGFCSIVTTADTVQLLVDGQCVKETLAGYSLYWIADNSAQLPPSAPEPSNASVPKLTMKDGFMRKDLAQGSWTVTDGTWKMKQYGGGMPETEADMKSYNFQRAVNPFSVVGKGILTYGATNSVHHLGEACIYFGKLWRAGAVDKNTLPKGKTFISQGTVDGQMVGFGWDGDRKRFVLVKREGTAGEWELLAQKDDTRPPLSNWVKIGLQIRSGWVAEGLIDGVVVVAHKLDKPVSGPFHIIGLDNKIEFDDFSVTPVGSKAMVGQPLYIRSRNFAGKKEKNKSDPEEFGDWARGEDAYLKTVSTSEDERFKHAVLLSRWPLMGDFDYQAVPESDVAGAFPAGVYTIELLKNPSSGMPSYADMIPAFSIRVIFDGDEWSIGADDDDATDSNASSEPQTGPSILKLRRREANNNVIERFVDGKYSAISSPLQGPVHIAISRVLPRVALLNYPNPEHHDVVSAHLINEFFEGAPTDWSWVDGAFRMDSRWACQNQWNFMACGSREVPMLVSKRVFSGSQEHEYFLSLRPMFPSDAGDPSFTYSARLHRELLQRYSGWYSRHDFNFSFCTDGKNPLSGYSIIFGGADNTETRLLRKGEIVARTKSALFPKSTKVLDVHWKWWQFAVRKYGNRIIVLYKDQPIFDYTDSDPIDGGHIAFWSVRNGFTISKIASTAESVGWKPDVLHVPEDTATTGWTPLIKDSVHLEAGDEDQTVVTANVGAGSMGTRYRFRPPIILKRKPNMVLPLDVGPGTMVNVYLQIDDKSFVIEVNAPLSGCKSLLTPEFEPDYNIFITDRLGVHDEMKRNEFFQVSVIPESKMNATHLLASFAPGVPIKLNLWEALQKKGFSGIGLLRSITIGNASNTDYLQAGGMANNAGANYSVGTPVFSE